MAIKGRDILTDRTKAGSTIPMSDPRVHRIDFEKSDLGARKSHTKGLGGKNSNSIQHTKGS